jgi:high-affinity nickel-transport protein
VNPIPAPSILASAPSALGAATLGLGLLFGLKHATEPDHVAAVSSVVSEQRNMRRALWIGGLWGAGHTISILAAGLFVLALHVAIPDSLARGLELLVALMIIGLGAGALVRALRSSPARASGPGATPGLAPASQTRLKPLLIGMMHGLAGSAALTLLVLGEIPSFGLGMTYLLIFGLGSIGGMALMSLLIGLPFALTAGSPAWNRGLRLAAAVASLAFGVYYTWVQVAGGVS